MGYTPPKPPYEKSDQEKIRDAEWDTPPPRQAPHDLRIDVTAMGDNEIRSIPAMDPPKPPPLLPAKRPRLFDYEIKKRKKITVPKGFAWPEIVKE